MIEIAHIATGALVGREIDGPVTAFLAGVVMHGLMDVVPHGEIHDRAWEEVSTVAGIAVLAARYGLRSPIVWGAIGSVIPDGEHVLPASIKPKQPVFPTHRIPWLHSVYDELAIPAWLQVVAGGAVIGALVAGSTHSRRSGILRRRTAIRT